LYLLFLKSSSLDIDPEGDSTGSIDSVRSTDSLGTSPSDSSPATLPKNIERKTSLRTSIGSSTQGFLSYIGEPELEGNEEISNFSLCKCCSSKFSQSYNFYSSSLQHRQKKSPRFYPPL